MWKSVSLLILLSAAGGTAVWVGSDGGDGPETALAPGFEEVVMDSLEPLEPGRLDLQPQEGLVRETLAPGTQAEASEEDVYEVHGISCARCRDPEPGEKVPTYLGARTHLPKRLEHRTRGWKGIHIAVDWIGETVAEEEEWPNRDLRSNSTALLALIGGGHTLSSGRHKQKVCDGINWLKETQRRDEASFGFFTQPQGSLAMRGQILATLAMSESYWCSNQTPVLKRPMRHAVTAILSAANFQSGWGIDTMPGSTPDLRTTNLALLSLEHAKANRLSVHPESLQGGRAWLDLSWEQAEEYGLKGRRLEAIAAADLLHTMLGSGQGTYTDWRHHPEYPRMTRQAALLQGAHASWCEEPASVDLWTWVTATEAMHQWGGPAAKAWLEATEDTFLDLQETWDPKHSHYGSWEPRGVWSHDGDRLYVTSMITYLLETEFRRGPLLQH